MSEHQVTRNEGYAQRMDAATPETDRALAATAALSPMSPMSQMSPRPTAESLRHFARVMEQPEGESGLGPESGAEPGTELGSERDAEPGSAMSVMSASARDGGGDSPSPTDILSSMAGSMASNQALTSSRTRMQARAHREGPESEPQGQGRKTRQRHEERTALAEGIVGAAAMTLRESTAQTVLVSEAAGSTTGGEATETLAATVAERILVADRPQGTTEVRIQLHSSLLPEAEVRLVRQADGGLQVALVTDNKQTFQTFVDAQAALQARLERFEDAGVRIVVASQAEADSGDARQRSRGEYAVDAEEL